MSIETQKKLKFIPIINIITMFAWIRICFIKSIKPFDFLKNLLKMFFIFVIITIPRIVCFFALENDTLDRILTYVSIYLYFLTMSWISVESQEEIMQHKNN